MNAYYYDDTKCPRCGSSKVMYESDLKGVPDSEKNTFVPGILVREVRCYDCKEMWLEEWVLKGRKKPDEICRCRKPEPKIVNVCSHNYYSVICTKCNKDLSNRSQPYCDDKVAAELSCKLHEKIKVLLPYAEASWFEERGNYLDSK